MITTPHYWRDKPQDWSPRDYESAPYLRGLPELPDAIAVLAGSQRLTAEEEIQVDAHLRPVCAAVRAASERWNAALALAAEAEAAARAAAAPNDEATAEVNDALHGELLPCDSELRDSESFS